MNKDVEELIARWPLIKDFQLPDNADVVVVGAYKGLAMEALAELYPTSKISGFEPQSWAFEEANSRLVNYPNARVANIGLGVEDQLLDMGEWHTDAASFINTGPGSREQGTGYIGEADKCLRDIAQVTHIDLMIVNIEGYEYKLLPHLRSKGWFNSIERLAVQWHLFPEQGFDEKYMNQDIDRLIVLDDYLLRRDERPAWTYFVKDLG